MGEKTNISWCDSTWNPWIGCMKVSEGCRNCYAETMMDKRYGRVQWGQMKTDETAPSVGTRVRTSKENWRHPVIWDRHHAAFQAATGHRQRVFCSSLADVFDNQVPEEWRTDLYNLIVDTPNLDWLLLTKRPENIARMMTGIPPNVWLGTACEDQGWYDYRVPILMNVPASVHFVSYESAIGPVSLNGSFWPDWLICGGESGGGHREMPEEWARNIMGECADHGIPFFMKQMAGKKPIPSDMMVRQFPVGAR